MTTFFTLIHPHDFWALQKWLNCQLLVEEIIERRVGAENRKYTIVAIFSGRIQKWAVDLEIVLHQVWWKNGTKMYEYHYKDGKDHGTHDGWYANGEKWYKHQYKHGRQHGKQEDWYKNGKMKHVHHYKNGVRHGVSLMWDEFGKLIKTMQ